MDLFELNGRVVVNLTDAVKAFDEIQQEGKKTESKLSGFFSGVGKGALAVGKAVGTGLLVAGTAVAGLVTNATSAYAEYEQLVGGVDTLFKESSAKVQAYAEQAYQTAGMSANEYMNTVTSFSASLLQSLGGDTEKAADQADVAIRDMSDNANKMGTSMESIQNAYQGFAKQNYTMLDNLKLGYGGTKEEMERLIADANRVKEANGEMANLSIDSFADVTEAIHIIQTEMGITGTTASEAAGTISGSMSSVKGAWTNLVTAMASDELPLGEYIDKFVESAVTMVGNMMPRIQQALTGVVDLIDQLAPVIINKLPELLSQLLPSVISTATSLIQVIVEMLPDLIDMLVNDALPQFLSGFVAIVEALVMALPSVIEPIVSALPALIPMVIEGLVSMFVTICSQFADIIQPIIDYLPEIIISLVDAIMNNLPIVIEGLITLVLGIVSALPQIIQALIDALPFVVKSIVTGLFNLLPVLIQGLIDLFSGVAKADASIFGSLKEAFVNFFTGLWNSIKDGASKAWDGIKNAFSSALTWFTSLIITPLTNFFTGMWNGLKDGASKAWNGIKSVFSSVSTWFKDTFQGAWTKVKGVFSTGGKIFDGIKEGIVTSFKTVVNAIITGINKVVKLPFEGLNTVLNKIYNVSIAGVKPFNWLTWRAPIPEIPKLAEGGVVDKPTPAIFGEDGAEAVVPLENNTGWINRVATQLYEFTAQNKTDLDGVFSSRMVELQGQGVSELRTLNGKVDSVIVILERFFPELVQAVLADKRIDFNRREFARLVKEAV